MERMVAKAPARRGRRGLSYRAQRRLSWVSGLILVAGVVAAIIAFVPRHHAAPSSAGSSSVVAKPAPAPKKVPLSKAATAVARTFLTTAVARADLDKAWTIAGPKLRGDLTHAEWMTGNIPVIPYPIKSLAVARFKIDFSYEDQALLEVALLPKQGAAIKGQTFFLELRRVAGPGGKRHWVVDSWVPRSSTLVPKPAN